MLNDRLVMTSFVCVSMSMRSTIKKTKICKITINQQPLSQYFHVNKNYFLHVMMMMMLNVDELLPQHRFCFYCNSSKIIIIVNLTASRIESRFSSLPLNTIAMCRTLNASLKTFTIFPNSSKNNL
jgi:hypothetical protein